MRKILLYLSLIFSLLAISQLTMAAISITNVSYKHPECGCDGSITVTTNVSAFYYSLNGGTTWEISPKNYIIANNICGGTFNICVKGTQLGKVTTYSGNPVVLNVGKPVSITNIAIENAEDCTDTYGSIAFTASGFPHSYSIDGGSSWSTSSTFTVALGTYQPEDLMVKSTTGCEADWTGDSIVVSDEALETVSNMDYETTIPTCNDGSDGIIELENLGAGYQYSIDNGENYSASYNFEGLQGDSTYITYVSYNNECYYQGPEVYLSAPRNFHITNVAFQNSTITIYAEEVWNGTYQDMGNISYSIDNGVTFQSSNTFTGLANGEYNVVIKYGNCEKAYENNPVYINDNIVSIPDSAFKAALTENNDIDSNNDGEIQYSEANNLHGTLYIRNKNISDLTGIEAFINIERLYCNNNQIETLDISNCTLLTNIDCSNNQLTSLDLSNNPLLTGILCLNNQLTTLDLSNNPRLTSISCYDNQLTTLDLSNNPQLRTISCYNNQLTALDFSNNPLLERIYCYSNQLTSLNISGCTLLDELQCSANELSTLDVSDNTALTSLRCSNNELTNIDVSNNLNLDQLSCSENQLTSLDVSHNTLLTTLSCNTNLLTSLNASSNHLLVNLFCDYNQITTLDLSNNDSLEFVGVSGNNLQILDLRNGNNTNVTLMRAYNNPNLTCVSVDDADWAQANWRDKFDETACFSNDCNSLETYTLTFEISENSSPLQNAWVYFSGDTTYTDASGQINYTVVPGYYYYTAGKTNYTGENGTVHISDSDTTITIDLVPDYNVYIPDANFKNYLLALEQVNTNGDNEIQATEARSCTFPIAPWNREISDLTGIEEFTEITSLRCQSNQLTTLDVSNNIKLTDLSCSNNQLTTLDVSNNTLLTTLGCSGNQLTTLDVSNNTFIEILYIGSNQLSSTDVSNNLLLEELLCNNNNLQSLDVSNNTALTRLECNNNLLDSLNVTNNSGLITLKCHYNNLKNLDIRNGNNSGITSFNAEGNDSLHCINVSDVEFAQANWTSIPDGAIFHTDCGCLKTVTLTVSDTTTATLSNVTVTFDETDYTTDGNGQVFIYNLEADTYNYTISKTNYISQTGSLTVTDNDVEIEITLLTEPIVYIPDNNFKWVLKNYQSVTGIRIDQNGDREIQIWEAEAFTDTLFVDNNVEDLTGIEAFTNIIGLDCEGNNITNLDLSENTQITYLDCSYNEIGTLDLTQNTLLVNLDCSENELTSLDISTCSNLVSIICYNNQLTALNVSQSTHLIWLECYDNFISSLDVTQNTALTYLYMGANLVSELDLTNNTLLIELFCTNNQLSALDVSQNTALTHLCCGNTVVFDGFHYDSNTISSLNLSENTQLEVLSCYNIGLTSLDLRNNNNERITLISVENNPDLNCVSVDNVAYAEANWEDDFDEGTRFSTDCSVLPTYAVSFHVTDGTNNIEGATVTFSSSNFITDADGLVDAGDYLAGDYNYTVTCEGYIDATGTITVVEEAVNETVTLEAYTMGGTVTVVTDGTLQYGENISLDLTGITTNIPEENWLYQWYSGGQVSEAKNGATSSSFTIEEIDLNRQFFCIVSNTINNETIQSNISEEAEKADQIAPAAPTVESTTTTTIYLNEVEGCEYAIDGGEWGSTFEFTGLTENTEYSFTQRYIETNTLNASEASDVLLATTDSEPVNALTGTATITGTLQYGETLTANVSNSNNTGILSYQWKRNNVTISNASNQTYTLIEADITTTISVEISSSVETGNISCTASTPVEKANQDAPAEPNIVSTSETSIVLTEVVGCEYCAFPSMVAVNPNSLPWQNSPQFTGLNSNTEYVCKQRYAETSTHNASLASSGILVTTLGGASVPEIVNIEDETFDGSSVECFGATQTIVVAKNGNQVLFQNGSNTNLIAGQSIQFLPGTVIEPGAYVHAYITINNSFCDALPEAIVAAPKVAGKSIKDDDLVSDIKPQQASIKVFPNPNNGQFNIVANGFDDNAMFIIYNPLGRIILKDILRKENALDLSSYNKGLYFIKTISNNKVLTQKILIR